MHNSTANRQGKHVFTSTSIHHISPCISSQGMCQLHLAAKLISECRGSTNYALDAIELYSLMQYSLKPNNMFVLQNTIASEQLAWFMSYYNNQVSMEVNNTWNMIIYLYIWHASFYYCLHYLLI